MILWQSLWKLKHIFSYTFLWARCFLNCNIDYDILQQLSNCSSHCWEFHLTQTWEEFQRKKNFFFWWFTMINCIHLTRHHCRRDFKTSTKSYFLSWKTKVVWIYNVKLSSHDLFHDRNFNKKMSTLEKIHGQNLKNMMKFQPENS